MGLFGFLKKSVSDLYIASPPEAAQSLVWMYPDRSIPHGAKVTVRSDEVALFILQGRQVGVLEPGTHLIESQHLPFLGDLVVSPLTGDNHYLTELFFVRRSEHLHRVDARGLGTYTDLASDLLVNLGYSARFALRVTAPLTLIKTLGGQNAGSAQRIAEFVDARLTSLVALCVGRVAATEPVTQIVSNQYSEEFGRMVLEATRSAFSADGLEITRFLELRVMMDPASEAALREHGRRLSELRLQREGAEIARNPGFAAFHLAQGQRAMLEGLGQGTAAGHAVMPLMSGLGLGMPGGGAGLLPSPGASSLLPPPGVRRTPEVRVSAGTADRWYLRTERGVEGPYGARQLVLRAISAGLAASTASVRADRSSDWLPLEAVEELAAEFHRRGGDAPRGLGAGANAAQGFELALTAAARDGVLSRDELGLLAGLAEGAGLARGVEAAEQYVIQRAKALGCSLEATSLGASAPPMLPAQVVFSYSNGMEQSDGLSADAVAARVSRLPDGVHLVWRPGMSQWTPARDVPEIVRLVR